MNETIKIAAATILFYPPKNIIAHVSSYLNFVDRLYLIDNSPFENQFIHKELNSAKVIYIHNGENKGIATRLNEVTTFALQDEMDLLLTMDQDSFFNNNTVHAYFNCIKKFRETDKVALFAVESSKKPLERSTLCLFEEVLFSITSGSVLHLKNFLFIGKFDEQLFIDEVDHEYCLRSILKGFKIIKFNNIYMHHTLGNTSYHRSLKSFKNTPRVLHSPFRLYYMVRNHFYIKAKYNIYFKDQFKQRQKDIFVTLKNNLLYGNKKLKTLKYILKGYWDFKHSKMGKYIAERAD